MSKLRFLGLAAVPFAAVGVGGTARTGEIGRYDAEVAASVVRQTPTVIGPCGDDCIVIGWPWVVELRVRRVHSGRLEPRPLTVLRLQHGGNRSEPWRAALVVGAEHSGWVQRPSNGWTCAASTIRPSERRGAR